MNLNIREVKENVNLKYVKLTTGRIGEATYKNYNSGRTKPSVSLLGVDAMIETMEEMKNKLTLAIPLCTSAESIDSEIDLKENQEFTDISIALWKAYKEEHIEALLHNLDLEKGDKKGKKKDT